MELERMVKRVRTMVEQSVPITLTGTAAELREIRGMDEEVDALHAHIVEYLAKLGQRRLTEAQTRQITRLLSTVNDLESIGDVVETNIVSLGLSRGEAGFTPSEQTRAKILEFHAEVLTAFDLAAAAACSDSGLEDAAAVVRMKGEMKRHARDVEAHEAARLVADEPNRLPAYRFEMDLLETLRRVYYLTRRIARSTRRAVTA